MTDNLIQVGFTKKAHGARGELKIHVEDRYLEDFAQTEVIFIKISGKPVPYFVEDIRAGNELILKLETVDSPSQAVPLTSKELAMRETDLIHAKDIEEENFLEFKALEGYLIIDEEAG